MKDVSLAQLQSRQSGTGSSRRGAFRWVQTRSVVAVKFGRVLVGPEKSGQVRDLAGHGSRVLVSVGRLRLGVFVFVVAVAVGLGSVRSGLSDPGVFSHGAVCPGSLVREWYGLVGCGRL